MNYPINEIFLSYQGEGFNIGRKCMFIRLSGCNLQCPYCDTEHQKHKILTIEDIIDEIRQHDCENIVITGGEPTIYRLRPLLYELKELGKWIALETNGTNNIQDISDMIDYVAVSPKDKIGIRQADEVRLLTYHLSKDRIIEIGRMIRAKHYFLSPVDSDGAFNILETMILLSQVNEVQEKEWFFSIQAHKLAGIR